MENTATGRDNEFHLLLSDKEMIMLDHLTVVTKGSRSDILRKALKNYYDAMIY